MKKSIFREKSIERVNSPDQLNNYISATTPRIWIVLSAIFVLVVGIVVWSIFGRLKTVVNTVSISDGKQIVCYISEKTQKEMTDDTTISIDGTEYKIEEISVEPIKIESSFSDYAMSIGGFTVGEWVYEVILDGEISKGTYETQITLDTTAPISFIIN